MPVCIQGKARNFITKQITPVSGKINGVLFPQLAVFCTMYISACLLRRDERLHVHRECIALLKQTHHCLAEHSYDIMVCQEQSLNLW